MKPFPIHRQEEQVEEVQWIILPVVLSNFFANYSSQKKAKF